MQGEPCQVWSKSQWKEPAIPMEIPSRPWQKLGVDLFLHDSSWYVIVADYYSKYPCIFQLADISSKDVISALKFCFSEFGIPEEVISDNGPQFTAKVYQDFAAQYGFRLTTSSPYYYYYYYYYVFDIVLSGVYTILQGSKAKTIYGALQD